MMKRGHTLEEELVREFVELALEEVLSTAVGVEGCRGPATVLNVQRVEVLAFSSLSEAGPQNLVVEVTSVSQSPNGLGKALSVKVLCLLLNDRNEKLAV